jgi:hypothetical protein
LHPGHGLNNAGWLRIAAVPGGRNFVGEVVSGTGQIPFRSRQAIRNQVEGNTSAQSTFAA